MRSQCALLLIRTLRTWCILGALLASGDADTAESDLSVSGQVAHPVHFSMAQLRSLASQKITVTQISGHGPVKFDCKGAPIDALLDRAGSTWGTKRNAFLAHSLLVSGSDGYAIALSLGEIDRNYGRADPIIAVECDGKVLDSPRLVVPSDKHAGRAIKDVVAITVK